MTALAKCGPGTEPLLAEEEQPEERRLGEEGEHALQGEREPDDPARVRREARPVRAELELHRDPRDDAHAEVDREDLRPEAREVVVPGVLRAEREPP